MKSFVVALILFITVIFFTILNSIYITQSCEQINFISNQIASDSDREANIQRISETWESKRIIFELSIRTNEIERMNDLVESLKASYLSQNEAELQKNCALISELATDLSRYESISIKSIC